MYSWTESPQMREKLTSIIENRFCAAAAPAGRIVRLPSGLIWMTLLESHHSDWMAARIIASYFDLRPVPGAALMEPSAPPGRGTMSQSKSERHSNRHAARVQLYRN